MHILTGDKKHEDKQEKNHHWSSDSCLDSGCGSTVVTGETSQGLGNESVWFTELHGFKQRELFGSGNSKSGEQRFQHWC